MTPITNLSADLCALSRLPESLVRLDLKGNRITTVQERALKPLKRLQVLNLRKNRLSSLPAMSLLPRLRTLYLEGNRWNCTCERRKVKRELLAWDVDMSTEFCTEPVPSSLDIWQTYIMAQEMCEEQNRELFPQSHTANADLRVEANLPFFPSPLQMLRLQSFALTEIHRTQGRLSLLFPLTAPWSHIRCVWD